MFWIKLSLHKDICGIIILYIILKSCPQMQFRSIILLPWILFLSLLFFHGTVFFRLFFSSVSFPMFISSPWCNVLSFNYVACNLSVVSILLYQSNTWSSLDHPYFALGIRGFIIFASNIASWCWIVISQAQSIKEQGQKARQ